MSSFTGFRYLCVKCRTSIERPFIYQRVKCPVCGNVMNYMGRCLSLADKAKGGDPKP